MYTLRRNALLIVTAVIVCIYVRTQWTLFIYFGKLSTHNIWCDNEEFFMFYWPASRYNRVKKNQIDAHIILSIFPQPLQVSGVSRTIIRRYNLMYATIGTYYSFSMTDCCPGWIGTIQTGQQSVDIHMTVHHKYISELQPTRCKVSWFIYFYRRSTCFRRFIRPSSGAQNCIYRSRYCQPILLLAASVDEMRWDLIHSSS